MNETQAKVTPKDFFLWVGAIVTLYISAVSLLTLIFQYIDRLFEDKLDTYVDPYSGVIRFAIASLIIIFPLYLYFTRTLNNDMRKNPEKKELWVRRWLLYFTLFVAGATIVVDLIVLINTYLGGEELTIGFLLKILSIIVVIGGTFLYYWNDLKGVWEHNESLSKNVGAFVSLCVLGVIVSGFFIMGSPQTQRLMRFDQERVRDLNSVQWQIVNFYQQKERLPESLSELEDPLTGFVIPTDPETKDAYGYIPGDELTFSLCANFKTESRDYVESSEYSVVHIGLMYDRGDEYWKHGIGEECFMRTIDPDKFPLIKELR
ncbi:MAG: DUF5671 domain-containing protein [Candidatus Pacebacteria bacterium]|nr:DUF5671 domain-containing protein [Candidatus Paceibacterota bacterium]